MSVITDILSAPFQGVLNGVAGIISKFVKDPTAAMQAQVELASLTSQTNIAILQADQQFANAQAGVIEAENKEGWLAANWRPLLMLVFTLVIANNYLFVPWFGVKAMPLDDNVWTMLHLGVTGYIAGRSVEKFLPDTAASIATAVQSLNKKS